MIIFCRGVHLTENTTQAASVRLVRCKRTRRARSRLQSFCQKRALPFFDSLLYVFLVFQTEEVGQKDGGDSQTQLCGVALGKDNEKAPAVSRCFWQRMRDSNPRKRSQSPVCYRYTNPLYPFGNVPIISNLSEKSRKIFRVPGKFFAVGVWGRKHPVSQFFRRESFPPVMEPGSGLRRGILPVFPVSFAFKRFLRKQPLLS